MLRAPKESATVVDGTVNAGVTGQGRSAKARLRRMPTSARQNARRTMTALRNADVSTAHASLIRKGFATNAKAKSCDLSFAVEQAKMARS